MKKAIPAVTVGAALAASLLLAAPAQAAPPPAPSGLQIESIYKSPTGYNAHLSWSAMFSSVDSYPTNARITTSAGYSGLAGSSLGGDIPIPAEFTSVVVTVTLLHNDEAGAPATVTLTRPVAPTTVRAKLVPARMMKGCLGGLERSPARIDFVGLGGYNPNFETVFQVIQPGKKAWKSTDGVFLKKAKQAGVYLFRAQTTDNDGVLSSPWSKTFKIKVTARQITATKSARTLATRALQNVTPRGC
ncbi:MAG: hypothetical protein WCP28_08505 [Actinomycetes bacterium]